MYRSQNKKRYWIWNNVIKLENREVVELLKWMMITRTNQWNWIFWECYNWRMGQSKYKGIKIINFLRCYSSLFSLSYMWVYSIGWTLAIIVCGRIDYKLDSYPTWLYIHLHTMGEKRYMFAGFGWEKKIRSLGDPHILVNSSPEFEFRPRNQGSYDYDWTPFS